MENEDASKLLGNVNPSNLDHVSNMNIPKPSDIDPKLTNLSGEPSFNLDLNIEKFKGMTEESRLCDLYLGDGKLAEMVERNNSNLIVGKAKGAFLDANLGDASCSSMGVNIEVGKVVVELWEINVVCNKEDSEVEDVHHFSTSYSDDDYGEYEEPFQPISHRKGKTNFIKVTCLLLDTLILRLFQTNLCSTL